MSERRYSVEPLPYSENVERFAPPYTPERFTQEEILFLKPFFSNTDRPVFVIQHLPEEVIAALSSRYSRTTDGLRRVFLREYVYPVVYPERQKDWDELTQEEKTEREETSRKFLEFVDFTNTHGGIDAVVNIQRARKFFQRWLAEYGDDSIEELGGVHLCIEGLSNIAVKEIEDKRIGISPLEKSTRYVSFADRRADGEYQYLVPGEMRGTPEEALYREAMDLLFDTYTGLLEPYLDYIKERYPKDEDETDTSFLNSRKAKRFDDLRDLLPFSTQTNVALFGNGRAFEDLIHRLMFHPLGEIRYWGQQICNELERVVPSFVERPKTKRGAEVQLYRRNIQSLRGEIYREEIAEGVSGKLLSQTGAELISHSKDGDIEILTAFIFSEGYDLSYQEIRERVSMMGLGKRKELFERILEERKFGKSDAGRPEVRFRKVPRAFENAHYTYSVNARGGDYRDLQRHRQLTQERQRFGVQRGYDLEKEVLESPFAGRIVAAFERAVILFQKIQRENPDVAQYVVPFGFIQHWYITLSAREIYWIAELRTGPQGRPHYRKISQEIARRAIEATPFIFSGMMVDWNDYSISRRESEKKIEAKLNAFKR